MKKHLVYLIAIVILISACKSSKESSKIVSTEKSKEMTTPSGLKYIITQNGNGKSPKKGDRVTVHYTGKFTNDTIFDSSVRRGQPFTFILGAGQVIKGWDEGVALLKVGDKATFTIPPELGYGDKTVGPIPPNSNLIFDVELLNVIEKVTPQPFDVKGKDTLTTSSGLKYIIVKLGEGEKAEPGKTVSVNYTGYFLNDSIFDSSVERGEPITFPLGQGYVIPGWEEGIALLKRGAKVRLIIPYQLAYGEAGRPPAIPPKATLVFDVELMDVK